MRILYVYVWIFFGTVKHFQFFCLFLQDSYSKNKSESTLRQVWKTSGTTQGQLWDDSDAPLRWFFKFLYENISLCIYKRRKSTSCHNMGGGGSTKVMKVKRVAKSEPFLTFMTLGSTMYVSSMFFVILCMPCSSRYFFKEIYSRSKKTAKKNSCIFFHFIAYVCCFFLSHNRKTFGKLWWFTQQLLSIVLQKVRETVSVV